MNHAHYSDSDRVRLAQTAHHRYVGPRELAQCEHGRFYSYRWVWSDSIENGDAEILRRRCQLCEASE